jgi:hypothetical protein
MDQTLAAREQAGLGQLVLRGCSENFVPMVCQLPDCVPTAYSVHCVHLDGQDGRGQELKGDLEHPVEQACEIMNIRVFVVGGALILEVFNMLVHLAPITEYICHCLLTRQMDLQSYQIISLHQPDLSLKQTHHGSSSFDSPMPFLGEYCKGSC